MMMQHTHRLPVRLSLRHKRWLYATAGLLFTSGLGWLIMHYLFAGRGDAGDAPHPSEPWWLRMHGAAAIGFLIALGSLLPGHISRAWQARRNHRSGLFMLMLVAALILTGYGLYYEGDEETRPWISLLHWWIGIAAAAGLPLHAVLGRRELTAKRPEAAGRMVDPASPAAIDAHQEQHVSVQRNHQGEKHEARPAPL